ncbi:MAG TPA: acetylglutamate kinase [Planctomycetes bacterium]|nr:acetylglutamate kinase [Planctomycetota bacterium]
MVVKAIEKARVLIEALPYIRSFRNRFVVIKIGGAAMEDQAALDSVMTDIVFMEQVGMWPVVVHGGGKAISRAMENAGIEPRFVNGLRYTDEKTMEIAQHVLIDEISSDVAERIRGKGGQAIPLNGRGSTFLVARKLAGPVDLGLVGEIDRVDAELCERVCRGGVIPVVAPIARGSDGRLYNVNADTCALAVAVHLKADKAVFMSDVPGILGSEDADDVLSTVTPGDIERLKLDGVIKGGMLPKVEASVKAIRAGVKKVHIVGEHLPHALLLEIFTDTGVGTQIVEEAR